MKVVVDAMGSDHAPSPEVAGALRAVRADASLEVLLVGDAARVEAELSREGRTPDDRVEVLHASEVVIAHGRSDASAIVGAIRAAHRFAERTLPGQLASALGALG